MIVFPITLYRGNYSINTFIHTVIKSGSSAEKKQNAVTALIFYFFSQTGPIHRIRPFFGSSGIYKNAPSCLDTVIIDTAGRLHIDDALMGELREINAVVSPQEILLVADAMTGQDAVNVAQKFDQELSITGVVLTKLEGDARGGAALSIQAVTGKSIKLVGVGEKLDALEPFHPDRIANRILGMGDVLSLIEKAQDTIDQKKALELQDKLKTNSFTLEDFRDQLRQIRKMGSLEQIISMIPGLNKMKQLKGLAPDEKELIRVEAIINSMTPQERRSYTIINASRRRRIANGSGTAVQDGKVPGRQVSHRHLPV